MYARQGQGEYIPDSAMDNLFVLARADKQTEIDKAVRDLAATSPHVLVEITIHDARGAFSERS
jgi:hypothetical protein